MHYSFYSILLNKMYFSSNSVLPVDVRAGSSGKVRYKNAIYIYKPVWIVYISFKHPELMFYLIYHFMVSFQVMSLRNKNKKNRY